MKKIVIVGGGTAGLLTAGLMHKFWDDNVQITLIFDHKNASIGVGESTTPIIHKVIDLLGLDELDLIEKLGTTAKLGVNFKDWIPGTEYFHGFVEVEGRRDSTNFIEIREDETSAIYSIMNDEFNGGPHFNKAVNNVPHEDFNKYAHALHIDTQKFADLFLKDLQGKIEIIDDVVERVRVNPECNEISHIECKKSGIINADFFVDCTGFACVLFKHLNPEWVDTSSVLPVDRAIPQQVPNNTGEIPAYTLAQATENGWIWRLPIGDRFGTGYLYSSKFTSDEEAREKYDTWLNENLGARLETDRIIKYRPGYYKEYWIGNCMAVGLSAGFIEPLESTSIQIISTQIYYFLVFNSALNNLRHTRDHVNNHQRQIFEECVKFLSLHYSTGRTDSEFWRYVTKNKIQWVKDFEEKCRSEFIDAGLFDNKKNVPWGFNSYVQVAYGHNLFNKDNISKYLKMKPNGQAILDNAERMFDHEQEWREESVDDWVPHKQVIESNTPLIDAANYARYGSHKY